MKTQQLSKHQMLNTFKHTNLKELAAINTNFVNMIFQYPQSFTQESLLPEKQVAKNYEKGNCDKNVNMVQAGKKDSHSNIMTNQKFNKICSDQHSRLFGQAKNHSNSQDKQLMSQDEYGQFSPYKSKESSRDSSRKGSEEHTSGDSCSGSVISRKSGSIFLPFSQSYMMKSISLEVRGWYYIDEEGIIQGPFTCIEMDNWFVKGYFSKSLLIAFKTNNKKLFFPLEKLQNRGNTIVDKEVSEFLKEQQSNFTKRSASLNAIRTERLGISQEKRDIEKHKKERKSLFLDGNISSFTPRSTSGNPYIQQETNHQSACNYSKIAAGEISSNSVVQVISPIHLINKSTTQNCNEDNKSDFDFLSQMKNRNKQGQNKSSLLLNLFEEDWLAGKIQS